MLLLAVVADKRVDEERELGRDEHALSCIPIRSVSFCGIPWE